MFAHPMRRNRSKDPATSDGQASGVARVNLLMQRLMNTGNRKQLRPIFWIQASWLTLSWENYYLLKNEIVMGQRLILIGFRNNSPPMEQVIHFFPGRCFVKYKMPITLLYVPWGFPGRLFSHCNLINPEEAFTMAGPPSLSRTAATWGGLHHSETSSEGLAQVPLRLLCDGFETDIMG